MPIDYLARRTAAEQGVSDIASGRSPEDELNKTYGNILAQRSRFLGKADQLSPSVSIGRGTAGINSNIVDRKTRATLNNQKRQTNMAKYNQVFNSAMDFASSYGMDRQAANQYARQIAEQEASQNFAAGEAQKGRNQQMKMSEMANQYAQAGVDVQNSYHPTADYGGALLRVLLGTGTAIGTYKYLNSKTQAPNPAGRPQIPGSSSADYTSLNNGGSSQYDYTNLP